MIGMTFYGEESEHIKHLEAEGIHVHESPKVMTVPLIILAGLTVIIGFLFPAFIEFLEHGEITLDYFVNSLGPYIIESFASPLFVLTMGMVGLGFIPSWYIYIQRKIDPKKLVEGNVLLRSLYKFLVNRWYFNALYYKIADFIRSLGGIANIIELLYDKILRKTVVLFNYIANGVRKVQTGLSNVNILYMIAGFIAFVAILLFI